MNKSRKKFRVSDILQIENMVLISLPTVLLLMTLSFLNCAGDCPDICKSAISEDMDELVFAIPASKYDSETRLYYKTYIAGYNHDTRQPNWVAWHLTRNHLDGKVSVPCCYREDVHIKYPRSTPYDYYESGYECGHMCPVEDNMWDSQAMEENYYMSNICPQKSSLRTGIWNQFEQQCREWVKTYGSLYIVSGPIFSGHCHKTIGRNRVVVPEAFFKVVLCMTGKPKAIGIIVNNDDNEGTWKDYVVSVDKIEELTFLDFFPSFSTYMKQNVESQYNISDWK